MAIRATFAFLVKFKLMVFPIIFSSFADALLCLVAYNALLIFNGLQIAA